MESNEQKSPEWYTKRLGRFTASQFSKLMKTGKAKDEIFGETAKTYILDKVAEIMTNGLIREYKDISNRACDWGNTYEPEAKRVYSEYKSIEVVKCGFFEGEFNTGASPDGLISEDGLLETKCPYDTTNHIRNLLMTAPSDLLKQSDDYYYQVMCQMWVTGRKWVDFVSYDPRATERTCLSIFRIERDEIVIEKMRERAKLAEILMNEIMMKIVNRNV